MKEEKFFCRKRARVGYACRRLSSLPSFFNFLSFSFNKVRVKGAEGEKEMSLLGKKRHNQQPAARQ